MKNYFMLFFLFITLNAFCPTFTKEEQAMMQKRREFSLLTTTEDNTDKKDLDYLKSINMNKIFNIHNRKKVRKIAKEIGVESKQLYRLFYIECRGDINKVNPYSRAVGLIQFLPNTAKFLGTDTLALQHMQVSEQLDYVRKYLRIQLVGRKINDFTDLYLVVFRPSAIGQSEDYVISEKGSIISNQNPAYRSNDGRITVKNIKRAIAILNI